MKKTFNFILIIGLLLIMSTCKKESNNNNNSSNNLPVLTTVAITSVTQTTAMSGGTITSDGGSTVTARGVCWSTGQTPTVANSKTIDGTGTGSFTSTIINLNPKTTYYVRAYATNSYGTAYGNEESFITLSFPNCGTLTDFDGNIYNTVTIGNQCWMQQNLATTTYNDGSAIPNVTDNSAWSNISTPAYCWYNDSVKFKNICGALYNWYTVNTGKLCPTGWHVPTYTDWDTLINFLGESGGAMKSTATGNGVGQWKSPNTGATNSSGFTALSGVGRDGFNGSFGWGNGTWWSSTAVNPPYEWTCSLFYNSSMVILSNEATNYEFGCSVRCVKD